jgi:hypothetical protein
MALRIDLKDQSASGQLNRWAAQHENKVDALTRQSTQLHTMLQKLFDLNPTLIQPTKK